MNEIIIQESGLISIKSNNLKGFLFMNINSFIEGYSYFYILVCYRNYILDLDLKNVILLKQYNEEKYLYRISFDTYSKAIDELYFLFVEYQMWSFYITLDDYPKFQIYSLPYPDDRYILYKGIEEDVIWISKKDVETIVEMICNK